jgi:hypothetical protein
VVLHEIAIPDPAFDPSPQINRLVASVLGAGVRS